MVKKMSGKKSPLERMSANVDTLIENGNLVLSKLGILQGEFDGLRDDLQDVKANMATKDNLEIVKEEVLRELKTVSKAVDKDAVTIISHERRLVRLERR